MPYDPLFKKAGSERWWCRVPNPEGGRHLRRPTGQYDRAAALACWRRLCRESVAGADQATHETSLGDALDRRIEERRQAGRAAGTLDMLRKKARQLTRVLGAETPLTKVDAVAIDTFIAERTQEGAARTTIHKELSTLRGALRLARRRREYPFAVDDVMPLDFTPAYRPRERALSEREIAKLADALPKHRRSVFLFLVATGATYPSEIDGLRRDEVDTRACKVRLRGTKRETRDRTITVVPFARAWFREAVRGMPFERWTNVRRDLHAACDVAGLERCSPNDLRRTIGMLMRARGWEPHVIGRYLGHRDSRMAEKVYAKLTPAALAHLLRRGPAGGQGRRNGRKSPRKAA